MKITMKVGLSGPEISLAPGDTPDYEDAVEAQRLIDAGFAELFVDEPAAHVEPAEPVAPSEPVTPAAPVVPPAPRAKASKASAAKAAGSAST